MSIRTEEPESVSQDRTAELCRRLVVVASRPRAASRRIVGAGIGELVIRELHILRVVGREAVRLKEIAGVAVKLVGALLRDDVVDSAHQVAILCRRSQG